MITRRSIVLAGSVGLLIAHRPSHGQPAASIHRVGLLQIGSEAAGGHLGKAFMQGMLDLGWRVGKNVEYRIVYANGDVDHLEAMADELIAQKAEVIVAEGSAATRATQRATKTVPIVMTSVSNPVSSGFVARLAAPGGNITGIASQSEEVLGKLIGILHEVTPAARRIAILLNENNPIYSALWPAAQSACAVLDLVAQRVVASVPAQLVAAVGEIVRQRSQAVVVVRDGMYLNERAKLQELMQATQLPVAYQFREHVVAGGLLSYASNLAASFRHAAKYVDKILNGAKPADLPVEQATKFELIINLTTAKMLGLTIPQSLLLRADEVIQQ